MQEENKTSGLNFMRCVCPRSLWTEQHKEECPRNSCPRSCRMEVNVIKRKGEKLDDQERVDEKEINQERLDEKEIIIEVI